MGIAPAGVKLENTGHHHLLLDLDEAPDFNIPLPASNKVIHFGKGQTETILKLKPGKHTLQLILGDYLHIPHDKPVISEKITIHVKESHRESFFKSKVAFTWRPFSFMFITS